MANEQIIRNGVIIENSLSFLGSSIFVTAITNNTILTDNDFRLVTESAIKNSMDSIEIGDLSSVTLTSLSTNDMLVYNGSEWVNSAISFDTNYVNITGDVMTGNLTTPSLTATTSIELNSYVVTDILDEDNMASNSATALATQQSIKAYVDNELLNRSLTGNTDVTLTTPIVNEFLVYDGTNWVNSAVTTDLSNYYTKPETDNKFVYTTGDTMTGTLILNPLSGNALETTGNVKILGDLYVSGTTTTVDSENLAIKDNLLLLNSGETGAGVSRGTAGFLVDRGTLSAVTLMYDEISRTARIGETTSTINDNTIDTSYTVALATILDYAQLFNNGFVYWKQVSATNGILMNLSGLTISGNNLLLNGTNIVMNSTETVDGVDISVLYDNFTNRSLSGNTDVTLTSVSTNDQLVYNGSQWVNSAVTTVLTGYYTKTEADDKFVDVTGDTMSGNLILPSLTALTSIELNSYIVNDILDEDNLNSDSDTALATQQSIKAYVDNELLIRSLTGNTDVTFTSLTTNDLLVYNGTNWINSAVSYDDVYVNKTGDTMTGDLTINTLSGTTDRLVYVDSNGKLSYSEEYVFKTINSALGAGTNNTDTFVSTLSKAVVWDYVIDDGTNFRAGTITAVWDGSNIEWNEVSTKDIGSIPNSTFSFNVVLSGGNVILQAVIGSGTWSVSTSRKMIG